MGWFRRTKVRSCRDGLSVEDGEIILHLDRVMLERGISLTELSSTVGISVVNLSKIKNNRVTAIRFSTLAALCSALKCRVSDLIEYRPDSRKRRR